MLYNKHVQNEEKLKEWVQDEWSYYKLYYLLEGFSSKIENTMLKRHKTCSREESSSAKNKRYHTLK